MAEARPFLALAAFALLPAGAQAGQAAPARPPVAAEINLSLAGGRETPPVEIAVPGRKPIYVASLVPRYNAARRQTEVELVIRRAGDRAQAPNLLRPLDRPATEGIQPYDFNPADFAPSARKPTYTGHRVMTARRMKMQLTVDVAKVTVEIPPGGKPGTYAFQTLDLHLVARDLGRRKG